MDEIASASPPIFADFLKAREVRSDGLHRWTINVPGD